MHCAMTLSNSSLASVLWLRIRSSTLYFLDSSRDEKHVNGKH